MTDPVTTEVVQSVARMATDQASRYLQQLCKHFGHKVPASFDAEQGEITFPFGTCRLVVEPGVLTLRVSAAPADLERMQTVIAGHLVRFAFREELSVDWQPA